MAIRVIPSFLCFGFSLLWCDFRREGFSRIGTPHSFAPFGSYDLVGSVDIVLQSIAGRLTQPMRATIQRTNSS
jgi:hypothetical protein